MNGSAPRSMVTTPEDGATSFLSSWSGEMYSSSEFTQPAVHIIEPPQPSQNARWDRWYRLQLINVNMPLRVTTPEKPFECHYCQKDFPKKADRDRHEASVHRGEMSMPPGLHDCPETGCTRDKGFTRKDNLLDHLRRVHNKDIPKRKPRIWEIEENDSWLQLVSYRVIKLGVLFSEPLNFVSLKWEDCSNYNTLIRKKFCLPPTDGIFALRAPAFSA